VTLYRPIAVAALLVFCSFTGCAPSEDGTNPTGRTSVSPTEPAPAMSSTSLTPEAPGATDQRLTRCDRVEQPRGGFGEGDFSVEATEATLGLRFSDWRNGRYRNVAYAIAYLDDPTCRTTPEIRRLLDRVDPPGWTAIR